MRHWSVVWVLAFTACSVPSLEELQSERPRACDEQHACGAGQVCISGACRESPCGSRTPTVAYVDMDRDGYAAVGAAPRVFCDGVPFGYATRLGDCDDNNPEVHPGAPELCNGRDDDCDGRVEEGTETKTWFLDADGDGFGRHGAGVKACDPPRQHVEISGDCDDERADVHPGAVELCNGVDDNCDGAVDEPFKQGAQALGTECVAICTGTYACNAAQTGTVCVAPPATSYYPDEDGDGEGQKDSEPVAAVCPGQAPPPLMAANTLDCDDHDSATNTQGMEVCDGLDNDCDGEVDELMSCGSLKMVADPALEGRQWRTVAVHPSGYPVWLAGMGGKLAVKKAPELPFVSHDGDTTTACGGQGNTLNWHAAWVNPANGHVFLAGQDGWIAEHDGDSCVRAVQLFNLPGSSDYLSGVVGIGSPLQVFVVSTLGHLFEWKASPQHHDDAGRYWGLHALGQDALYAVGTVKELAPLTPLVNLYIRQSWTTPTAQDLLGTAGYNGSLRAVWAANPSLIYAVGDAGLVVKGNTHARAWTRVLPPVGTALNYTSVAVPPETENAYIIGNESNAGRLHRLTRHGWAKAPAFTPSAPDVPLRDIAMTSAGDFWIVGDDGRVYHFPEP